MHHILGNKVLEYDVDDRGVIVDEREIDRTVNHKPILGEEEISSYLYDSNELSEILNSEVWTEMN